jgi:hypothetical protein
MLCIHGGHVARYPLFVFFVVGCCFFNRQLSAKREAASCWNPSPFWVE